MRNFAIPILYLFISCNSLPRSFDKAFYEKVSSLKLPKRYNVIESVDNGEFVTATIFQTDSLSLNNFIKSNNLKITAQKDRLFFFSEHLFSKRMISFINNEPVYFFAGEKGKNTWAFLADPKTNKILIEINYPDLSGQ